MNIKNSIKEIISEALVGGVSPKEALKSVVEALMETPKIVEERVYFAKIDSDRAVSFEVLSKKRSKALEGFIEEPDSLSDSFSQDVH